jgi:transposase
MKNKQKKPKGRRIDVNVEELDQIVDRARRAPLSDSDYDKLKTALHALIEKLLGLKKSEKLASVFGDDQTHASPTAPPRAEGSPGHGRNGAQAFSGAHKVSIMHQQLASGDHCPDCGKGRVYAQKEPKALVRIVGQAPLAATIYELQRLRCNACGQIFTAQEPEGVGPEKYDETAAAMIAQLKYGSGVPFNRLERMEGLMGIPLPAATQWEVVADAAELIKPARDELIRQAAQGQVLHNDDTSMRVLRLEREPSDQRTGVFTSGIVATGAGRKIALYFTGRQHAGENLAEVLKQRHRNWVRRFRCVTRPRAMCPNYPRAWRFWWLTALPTAAASLWKWRRAFPRNAVTCSKRWAGSITTTRRRGSRIFQPRNVCTFTNNTALR